MSLEKLISERPKFHQDVDGQSISWAVKPAVLKFIHDQLDPGMFTLETGAGQTTVVFAIAGTNHICITPNERESTSISEYCSDLGVESKVQFLNQSSDISLPHIASTLHELDFVFIDGAHRYPLPCIDFHYTESRLKVGGILGLDDIGMPSVKFLYDFLCNEDEWELIEKVTDTAFFRRVKKADLSLDWQNQNINKNWRLFTKVKAGASGLRSRLKRE